MESFNIAPAPGPLTEQYRSFADLVYERLREEILAWTLRPGDKLLYEAIASRLGVSTMPVREGVRRLVAEGYAESLPHRGARVAPCSIVQIRQTATVRAWLEADGIRAALPHLRGEALKEVERLQKRYRRETLAGDWPSVARTNLEFHNAIHHRAGNAVLLETLEDLYARTERVRGLSMRFSVGDAMNLLRDHEEIIRLIQEGDPDACARAMSRHVLRGLGRLADFLEEMYGPSLEVPEGRLDETATG